MNARHFLPSVLLAALLLAAGLRPALARPAGAADFTVIDEYIQNQMAAYRIPGLALAVVQGDQVVYLQGYGEADPSGRPVTPQTPFLIGSTGKSITATALMLLVDAGQVDLDAPVRTYLPWFTLADPDASARITVRMLLNHTSGIPEGTGWVSQGYSDTSAGALEEQVRSFASVKLNNGPGTAYEYANANYQIVGLVVQAVSGQSFQSFIQERIYAPLDMTHSYVSRDEARENSLAVGYRYWFGLPVPAYHLPFSYRQFPAGWYLCSAEDLAHYLVLHLNEGRYGSAQLISPEGMAALHTPALEDYAMGWVVSDGWISHNGGVPDYGSGLYMDPANGYGVVVLFNANTSYFYTPSYVIAPSILRLLTGQEPYAPVPDAWYRGVLIQLGSLFVLQTAWFAGSLLSLKRWRREPGRRPRKMAGILLRVVLPLLLELGMAAFLFSNVSANGRTVVTSFIYQPDVVSLTLLMLLWILVWGLARTGMQARLLRRE